MSDGPQKINLASDNPNTETLEALKTLLPGIFTDGIIDADRLSAATGLEISGKSLADEGFGLSWAGKKDSILATNLPTYTSLSPQIEESINWDTAKNVFIEGDNLEVLKLLQKAYNDQVKMIYIDPPYNTGNDFVYNDNFTDAVAHYLEVTGQIDSAGNRLSANTDTSGRRHSKWLSMMHPRLKLAFNLLRNDGAMFISIGPEELHHLTTLVEEVFGRENLVAILTRVTKTTSDAGEHFAPSTDFIIVVARDINSLPGFRTPLSDHDLSQYKLEDEKGRFKLVGFYQASLTLERSRNARYGVDAPNGDQVWPPEGKRWRTIKSTFEEFVARDEIVFKETKTSPLIDEHGNQSRWNVYTKQYLDRRAEEGRTPRTFIDDAPNQLGSIEIRELGVPFDFPKPTKLICELIEFMNFKDGIVLDFFAGSGTTGHSVLKQNQKDGGSRTFVLVNIPEPTSEKSQAFQAGIKIVSDLTKMRLQKVFSEIPGANLQGLRCLKLTGSNFLIPEVQAKSDELLLEESSLSGDFNIENITSEILLKNGVRLDEAWKRPPEFLDQVIVSNNVAVFATIDVNPEMLELLIENYEIQSVVFLEDAFVSKDDLKANLFFRCKNANVTMKTV